MSTLTDSPLLAAARRWIQRGCAVIPVPYGQKRPVIEGWPDLRMTERDAQGVFAFSDTTPQNLGLLLGEPSRGIVDVDLDTPAAVRFAAALLPWSTARYGRASAPSSHLLFLSPGAVTRKWTLSPACGGADAGVVLECRSTGAQSLVPPSTHPSGEVYTWEDERRPDLVAPAVLMRRLALIAAAVALQPAWASGGRHDITLALAGSMLSVGWTVDEVSDLVTVLERSTDAPELEDRLRAIADTATRRAQGVPVTGLPTLAGVIGEPLVQTLKRDEWLRLGALPVMAEGAAPIVSMCPGVDPGALEVVAASSVEARPIEWLWANRIPRAKLTLLAGKAGLSKSVCTNEISALISRGGVWPIDGTPCTAGDVLILSLEDDIADTVVPRLMAAGADLSRVDIIKGVKHADGRQRLMSLRDVEVLDRYLSAHRGRYKLLTIDPVGAVMAGADTHRDSDVRELLAPLAALAEHHRIAVVLVAHLNKSAGADAVSRILGSVAFSAAPRMVFILASDPEDRGRLLLLPEKTNLAPLTMGGLAYRLESVDLGNGITAPKIMWEGVETRTASEVLTEGAASDTSERVQARLWLLERLADGPVAVRDLKEAAGTELDVSWRTLKRAAFELKVIGAGEKRDRTWQLPDSNGPDVAPSNGPTGQVSMWPVDGAGVAGCIDGPNGPDPASNGTHKTLARWSDATGQECPEATGQSCPVDDGDEGDV